MKTVSTVIGLITILTVAYAIFAQFHHWSRTYSKKIKGLPVEKVWAVWTDVNNWHTWQKDIEYAKMEGEFKIGNTFVLKPKDVSAVTIQIINVETNKVFTDLTKFPLAKMYGKHEFIQYDNEIEIRTTMSVEGFLGFVWRKIVAEDVANGMPEQTESLIKMAKNE